MQDAKYSVNIRFNLNGYDCQFSARSDDDPGLDTLHKATQIVNELEKMGATGERRWEAAKNGKETHAPATGAKEALAQPNSKSDNDHSRSKKAGATSAVRGLLFPDSEGETGVVGSLDTTPCPNCGVVGSVEVIGFTRGGVYKQAPKCQACKKWLPQDN